MLNPVKEAIYSATYVDNYIDSVENLPDDVQRHLSRIRDIDVQYRNLLRDVDHYYDLWRTLQTANDTNSNRRARAITRMQQSLIQAQELGDEKMKVVNQLQELIDHKTRQLDTDQKNLDIKEGMQQHMQGQYRSEQIMDECGGPTPQKRSRTQSPVRDVVANGGQQTNGACSLAGSTFERALNGKEAYGSYNYSSSQVLSGSTRGSTPIGERTLSNSNGVVSSGVQSSGSASNIAAAAEQMRAVGKRARRRNETLNSLSMEHVGNDSNSANETGSNGAERSLAQGRMSALSGSNTNIGQKKHLTQNQSGMLNSGQMPGSAAVGSGVGVGTVAAGGGSGSGSGGGIGGGGAGSSSNAAAGKKKKRKTRGAHAASVQVNTREETPPPDPIDPDEPTYCVCNQISFGEMILCDNDLCPIEWFHFSCVSLVLKPKGKWYCPNCRGDRPNVMKPKAQFLKELERYNKEKEEKT